MRRSAALLAALLCTFAALPEASAKEQRFESRLERVVPGLLHRYEVPSAAIAVVRDGKVAWNRRFDHVRAKRDGDVFKVASLSKTATALAVLSLAEQGRLDLDAPIGSYLTRWEIPRSDFDATEVTARRLLSHTAGFPLRGRLGESADRYPAVKDVLEGRHNIPPVRLSAEPGTAFTYSNPGYVVLELIVEEATGKRFPEAMRDLVFRPLGMHDTGYDDNAALAAREVTGYERVGMIDPLPRLIPRGPGGMVSTETDIGKLLIGVTVPKAHGGLLEPNTLSEMHAFPRVNRGSFGLRDGGYALGLATLPLESGRDIVANNGSFDGFNSMLIGYPLERSGIVVLTNSNTGLGIELELAFEWADAVVGERPQVLRGIALIRSGIRYGTLVLLVLCLVFIGRTVLLVKRGERRWPGRLRLRPILLRSVPPLIVAVALVTVFLRRIVAVGIPAARFISVEYQWIVLSFAVSLLVIAVTAAVLPKAKATD